MSGRIGRANLDGSAVNQSFITGARSPAGVAANGQYVFWTNWGMYGLDSIGRANADGSGVTPSLIGSRSFPRGLAISGDYIYWTERVPGPIGPEGGEPDTDYVLRVHLDGSGAWSIVDAGTDDLFGTAVDAAHVYWINQTRNAIGRANPDGSGASQSFLTTSVSSPVALAVDPIAGGPPPGPSMPTVKEQCRHGGWTRYPSFKNQGECVSDVAAHADRGPAE